MNYDKHLKVSQDLHRVAEVKRQEIESDKIILLAITRGRDLRTLGEQEYQRVQHLRIKIRLGEVELEKLCEILELNIYKTH